MRAWMMTLWLGVTHDLARSAKLVRAIKSDLAYIHRHSRCARHVTSRHVTSRHVTRARVCVCTGTALSVCTRVAPMLTRMRGGGGVSRLAHFYLFFTFFFEICLFTTLPLSLRALTSNTSKTFHSPPANRNAAQSVES